MISSTSSDRRAAVACWEQISQQPFQVPSLRPPSSGSNASCQLCMTLEKGIQPPRSGSGIYPTLFSGLQVSLAAFVHAQGAIQSGRHLLEPAKPNKASTSQVFCMTGRIWPSMPSMAATVLLGMGRVLFACVSWSAQHDFQRRAPVLGLTKLGRSRGCLQLC